MISCTRFDELHLSSQDEPLAGTDRAEFEAHLAACPACVRRVTGYVSVTSLLRGLNEVEEAREPAPIPEEFVRRVMAAYKAERQNPGRARNVG